VPYIRHLIVERGRLRLVTTPERRSCRPAVDELYDSIEREGAPSTIACLLTGMGCDGATGLLALRRAGGTTLAQDETSSVIFGMPAEAIRLGAAQQMLPLNRLASRLIALARDRIPA
jgi:two-component system chemotaxis response regulator CheB